MPTFFRRIIALALVLIIISLVAFSLLRRNRLMGLPRGMPANVVHTPHGHQFGLVAVDTLDRRITFPARVRQDTGKVVVLLNLTGYPWLNDSAAMVSPARLLDLQQAIASLDWALWDSLWTGLHPGRTIVLRMDELDASQVIVEDSPRVDTVSGPSQVGRPRLADFVFLGMPEFDPAVLESGEEANCATCPAFTEESRVITEVLRRRTGTTGLSLRSHALPKPGSDMTVSIGLPK